MPVQKPTKIPKLLNALLLVEAGKLVADPLFLSAADSLLVGAGHVAALGVAAAGVYSEGLVRQIVQAGVDAQFRTNIPLDEIVDYKSLKLVARSYKIRRDSVATILAALAGKSDQFKLELAIELANFLVDNWDLAVDDRSYWHVDYKSVRMATLMLTVLPDFVPKDLRPDLSKLCRGSISNRQIKMASAVESLLVVLSKTDPDLAKRYLKHALLTPKWREAEYRHNILYSGGLDGVRESWLRHDADPYGMHRSFGHDAPRKLQHLLSLSPRKYTSDDVKIVLSLKETIMHVDSALWLEVKKIIDDSKALY